MKKNKHFYLTVAIALHVKGSFTYLLPEDSENNVVIGCRVLVPFRGRRVTGYIIEKNTETEISGVKPIAGILDKIPLFPEKMVPFFQWMADYYLYPIGRVIESVLPGGMNMKTFKTACLTDKGHEVLCRIPFHYEEACALAWVRDNAGKKIPQSLTKVDYCAKKGWIKIETRTRKGPCGPLMMKYVRLKKGVDVASVLDGAYGPMRSKNEGAFFEQVSTGTRVLLKDLRAKFSNAAYLVNKWFLKGVLESGTVPVYRNPAGEILAPSPVPDVLYAQQKIVFQQIQKMLVKKRFGVKLLFGVTGSGKTEVYFRAVIYAISLGCQTIVMVPEIALAVYMEGIFRSRLGDRVAIYHSGLSQGERHDEWMKMAGGKADVVIGARSALFAPFPRLGLIIVDEEHDAAYKQDTNPRYHARDAAVMRAKIENALVVLGSGTPSVQTYQNAISNKYQMLSMPERVDKRPLPEIEIINMKPGENDSRKKDMLSKRLKKAIHENLASGNQTLLFLNRRGFHRMMMCWSCGKPVTCPHCDVSLTHHLGEDRLTCHYCGFSLAADSKCPSCGFTKLRPYGYGTEKLEQELQKQISYARIARMDTDSTRKKGEIFNILRKFNDHKIDILVGTQMITKGYDFPKVTLVGVIAADLSLGFPDFRAGERTFQILSQVAGRAGRGTRNGRAIIQTFNPEHYAIQAATSHNFDLFFEKESTLRAQLGYPPFSHLAVIRIQGKSKTEASKAAFHVRQIIQDILDHWPKTGRKFQILGPAEAPVSKIKGKYRFQILIKCKSVSLIQHLLNELDELSRNYLKSTKTRMVMDVDPYQMS